MKQQIIEEDYVMEKDEIVEGDLVVRGNIYGKEKNKYNLTVKGDIHCGDINCWDINCLNINCRDINCWDINCRNINCGDIDCGSIDCENINYYAICLAYENIKCKSIKGRRNNCKHFVLDGEIIVDGKEEEK